jgi:ribose transport system substrate-binding protein
VLAFGLGACSTDPGTTPDDGGGSADLGNCGVIPQIAPIDPNGIVASLPADVQAGFNGYPNEVMVSAFKEMVAADGPVSVGLSMGANANQWTQDAIDELDELLVASTDAGLTNPNPINSWAADVSAQSPTAQIAGYQDQVRQGAKVILIVPMSGEALIPVVEEAGKQGVITVSFGGNIPSEYAINVYQNPFLNVATPTARIAEHVGGTGDFLLVHGISSFPIDQQGTEAAKLVLEECPGITIAGEIEGGYTIPTAKTETLSFLTSNPREFAGVIQMNAMAAGIISGFEQAGRTVPPVSMNTATEGDVAYLHDNMDAGYFSVGSVGSGASQLNAAFRVAMRVISGQGPITSEFITEAPLITPENVADYYVDGTDLNSTGTIRGDVFPDDVMDSFFTSPAPLAF